MIKKIFLSVLLCTVCMFGLAQSQTITHVVQRGETLESIAESYKVSVEDINKANPNADGIVYVGMKIEIPMSANGVKGTQRFLPETKTPSKKASSTYSVMKSEVSKAQSDNSEEVENDEPKKGDVGASIQFVPRFGSLSGDNAEHLKNTFGLSAALGAKYFLADKIFVEGLIGYRFLTASYKKKYAEVIHGSKGATGSLETHSIYIPLYVGAKLDNFLIKAGPYFDYIVSGAAKTEKGKDKRKDKITKDRLSVGLNLAAQYKMLGLNFNIGLTDYAEVKKCKEMAIGLIYGF